MTAYRKRKHAAIPRGDRRLRTFGLLCRRIAAEVRGHDGLTPTCASTCWRCCRPRGVWCGPASRPITRRSRPSAPSSRRRPPIPDSASSATSRWVSTSQAEELAERYDAVIYAVGAQSDRPLNIPGEDLTGSVAAVDFVGWYNAHPHFEEMTPDLSTGRAIVVGNGNVALDVARILVSDPDLLSATDIADHALGPAARPRRRGGRDHRPPRPPAGHLHHAGAARARRPRGDGRRRRDRRPGGLRRHLRRGPRGGVQERQAEHQGAPRVRRAGAARRQAPHRLPVPHLADRDQGRRPGRVDRARPQRAGGRRRPRGGQGHRRPRGTARAAGGSRRRLPRRAHARDCRSTNAPGRFRTPTAESTAAATSTWSGGSSAARPV